MWRQCGFPVPIRKPRTNVVPGTTLQPTAPRKHAVWRWDVVHDVTSSGEPFRCLTVKDEAPRWCVAIAVARALSHQRVLAGLNRLLVLYGHTRYVRSDNGPELVAQHLPTFLKEQGISPSRMTPGKPWQNGRTERFNGPFRREC